MIEAKEIKKVIKDSILIIIFSAIIGFAVNLLNPRGFILISKEEYNYNKIILISNNEAKIKYNGSVAIFIDSRSKNEYTDTHVSGAIHIPAIPESASLKQIKKNFSFLNQQKELIIYCSGMSCGTSEILAKRLIKIGYSNHIYIMKQGLPEWEANGYPVEGITTEMRGEIEQDN